MDKTNINKQHTASYEQLLSIARRIAQSHADSLQGYTAAQRALQQIAVMYLLPSYQPDKTYPEGSIVRVAGKVYKALQETSDSPVTFIGMDGTFEANDQWQVLIDHDVNDGNWARLDIENIPDASLPERLEFALYKINEWDRTINLDYAEWKEQKAEDFATMLAAKEQEFAPLYTEALQTINEQAKVIAEQRALIQQQADLLDEFSRSRFILDTYTPKPQDQDLNG